jgi:glycosyltransferase involved in cell wall biosynthesis
MRRPGVFDGAAQPRSRLRRLAIVSTYDELCGIAGYTRALVQQLNQHVEVTVFDLDQYLLRSPHRRVQRLADRHINDMARRLREFDSVNIQLEYGTLGRTTAQILRRLRRLVVAAPVVSITFHTILGADPLDWQAIGASLARGRIDRALRIAGSYRRNRNLAVRTYALLRSRQRHHPVQVIVHNKRDMRLLRDVYRIEQIHHHPLSFVSAEQVARIRATTDRNRFPILRTLPTGARLIGSFGFLSPYKGYETALRALHYLPEDHHLLIFGGIHPQTIKRELPLDPYIQTLFNEAHIGLTILDTLRDTGTPLTLDLDAASKDLLTRHPRDLHHRVHFLGVHDDEGFMAAMALCDAVVLPYLEVGQSSSGPIAMALDMGCRVLASRTLAFLQFARYHPDQVEFFDIGNYAELADLISADRTAPGAERQLAFNTQTNTALYLQANQPTRIPRHTLSARMLNYLKPDLEKFQPDNARLDKNPLDKNPAEKTSADEAQKESAA